MAHLVENMAYVGQTPWHGLGNQLTANRPIEEWVIQAGLNWKIEETPVRYLIGDRGHLGEIKAFPDNKVLYRSDSNEALSVVGNRYNVVQPREILEFYRDLTELSGFELETAGSLKGGRKIWALARTGQSTALKGKDVSKAYMLLATACDGTMATTAQFTSIRVVCNNTLAVALNHQSTGAVKVPHRSVFDADSVKQQLGITVSSWDQFMYRMKVLSDRKVKQHEAKNYLLRVFSDPGKAVTGNTNERAMNKALSLFQGEGKGSRLASAEGTAYGLLNAVTQFVDHDRRARSPDSRLDSAWFGQGATIKRKALDEALLMAA
jgi:phage/plasmid-like protein (TIGR03299 family)